MTFPCPACSTPLTLHPIGESRFDSACPTCDRAVAVVELDNGFSVALFERGGKKDKAQHNDEWLPDLWTVMKDAEMSANREAIPSVTTRLRRRRAKAS